jgi:exopolysaccharide production protein ExoZ
MLRAVAALLVVYTHSITQLAIYAPGWKHFSPASISFGTFGVDLFFVISGFIIYHSAERLNGRSSALSFLWHRFRRINPAYYAAVILTVITWIPSLVRDQRPAITAWQLLSWTILLPFPGDPTRALGQAWTLCFEWFFYLLFFLLILTGAKKKAGILCWLLGGLVSLGWVLQNYLTGLWIFYMDPLLLEFLLGVIIGFAYRQWNPGKRTALCLLVPGIVFALLFIVTGYGDSQAVVQPSPPIRYLHALSWGSAAALIVAGCVFLGKNGATVILLRHPLIRLLGDASYSIYLFHMLVLGLIAALYLRVGFFLNPYLAIPIHAAIAIAGSLFFYKWVEQPLLLWLKRYDKPKYSPPRSAKP